MEEEAAELANQTAVEVESAGAVSPFLEKLFVLMRLEEVHNGWFQSVYWRNSLK